MTETELGELVIKWLKETHTKWEVFEEIRPSKYPGSPIADIALINSQSEIWVIELKRSLSLEVIRQAYEWQVDYRSIATWQPKRPSKKTGFWYGYIKHNMGIGTILVNDVTGSVREVREPSHKYVGITSYPKKHFIEIMRSGKTEGFGKAGSKDGGHWTPYKESMKAVRGYVQNNPGCGVGDIVRDLGKLHYASAHSARTNLVKNLNELEGDWCEIRRRGTYDTFYVRKDAH